MGGVPVFVFRSFFVNLTKNTEIVVDVQNKFVFPYCREEVYLKKNAYLEKKLRKKSVFVRPQI